MNRPPQLLVAMPHRLVMLRASVDGMDRLGGTRRCRAAGGGSQGDRRVTRHEARDHRGPDGRSEARRRVGLARRARGRKSGIRTMSPIPARRFRSFTPARCSHISIRTNSAAASSFRSAPVRITSSSRSSTSINTVCRRFPRRHSRRKAQRGARLRRRPQRRTRASRRRA